MRRLYAARLAEDAPEPVTNLEDGKVFLESVHACAPPESDSDSDSEEERGRAKSRRLRLSKAAKTPKLLQRYLVDLWQKAERATLLENETPLQRTLRVVRHDRCQKS